MGEFGRQIAGSNQGFKHLFFGQHMRRGYLWSHPLQHPSEVVRMSFASEVLRVFPHVKRWKILDRSLQVSLAVIASMLPEKVIRPGRDLPDAQRCPDER